MFNMCLIGHVNIFTVIILHVNFCVCKRTATKSRKPNLKTSYEQTTAAGYTKLSAECPIGHGPIGHASE